MLDAIRYLVDNGTKWRAMPAGFPPWDRVYAFVRRWRNLVRERAGRDSSWKAGEGMWKSQDSVCC
ncbi:transposase [Streptomyces goshikiensis]|uniref:transposase n=1 Tax=Streptomyces goshikiensis TaxID=1942 RepID=UPI0036499813